MIELICIDDFVEGEEFQFDRLLALRMGQHWRVGEANLHAGGEVQIVHHCFDACHQMSRKRAPAPPPHPIFREQRTRNRTVRAFPVLSECSLWVVEIFSWGCSVQACRRPTRNRTYPSLSFRKGNGVGRSGGPRCLGQMRRSGPCIPFGATVTPFFQNSHLSRSRAIKEELSTNKRHAVEYSA